MIPEWPQVGDLLANAIEQAAGGGNVKALMDQGGGRLHGRAEASRLLLMDTLAEHDAGSA